MVPLQVGHQVTIGYEALVRPGGAVEGRHPRRHPRFIVHPLWEGQEVGGGAVDAPTAPAGCPRVAGVHAVGVCRGHIVLFAGCYVLSKICEGMDRWTEDEDIVPSPL